MRLFVKDGEYYGIDIGQDNFIPEGAIETTQAARDALPENVKARHNTSIKAQIVALEAEITPRLQRDLVLRPNATVSRPNSAVKTPKKPVDFIADIDAQIEALVATLIP